jgi:hypothetical protein
MKTKFYNVLKKHWITIIGVGFLGIILAIASFNFYMINRKTARIYDESKKIFYIGDSIIINELFVDNKDVKKYAIEWDSLHQDSVIVSQLIHGDIAFYTQRFIDLHHHKLKENLMEMESLKKGLFDSSTITFLVSFVLVFLGGILFNIEIRSKEQLRKITIQSGRADNRLKQIEKQVKEAETLLNTVGAQSTETKDNLDKADKQQNEAIELSKKANNQLNKVDSQLIDINQLLYKTKETNETFNQKLNESKNQLEKYEQLIQKYERTFNDIPLQIQVIRILCIMIQNIIVSKNYRIDESISSLIYHTYNLAEEIIKDIQRDIYKSITKDKRRYLDSILEKMIYAFDKERILEEPTNKDKTIPILWLIDKLKELQIKIQEIKIY